MTRSSPNPSKCNKLVGACIILFHCPLPFPPFPSMETQLLSLLQASWRTRSVFGPDYGNEKRSIFIKN